MPFYMQNLYAMHIQGIAQPLFKCLFEFKSYSRLKKSLLGATVVETTFSATMRGVKKFSAFFTQRVSYLQRTFEVETQEILKIKKLRK